MATFRAPGRVNLIGDHTDYNAGFALPVAIDLACTVTSSPHADETLAIDWLDGLDGDRYAAAIADSLARRGRKPVGIDATVTSTVPVGSGLASSAAVAVGLALALSDAADLHLPQAELARACRDAEEAATGVPCGVMDQLASLGGRAGCALLLDCRTLDVTPVPLPAELALVVIHSGLSRTLDATAYAARREACERAAARLGVDSLRDATPAQVADDPRARHVVSENLRVLAAADALATRRPSELGPLLEASHASLRDDFEVSTPELDELVACLVRAGALGARLTGAGFGGCVVALTLRDRAEAVAEAGAQSYRLATGLEPTVYLPEAVDGARRMDAPSG